VTPGGLRVVGVGNDMRGDDAAGLVVARRLRALAPEADVIERSGEPAELLDALDDGGEGVVLVDAVFSGAPPGEIHRLDASEVALPFAGGASTHGLGLAETIELGRALGRLPPQLLVYGIEGGAFELGAPLSPEVARAAATVAAELLRLLEEAECASKRGRAASA
jgi:hydrogenase maturation protease